MIAPVPALPAAPGPDERKARFFMEMSAAMEFMALFWACSQEDQQALGIAVHAAASRQAQRKVDSAR